MLDTHIGLVKSKLKPFGASSQLYRSGRLPVFLLLPKRQRVDDIELSLYVLLNPDPCPPPKTTDIPRPNPSSISPPYYSFLFLFSHQPDLSLISRTCGHICKEHTIHTKCQPRKSKKTNKNTQTRRSSTLLRCDATDMGLINYSRK